MIHSIARRCYTLVFYLCIPIVLMRLFWRFTKRSEAMNLRFLERFGFFSCPQKIAGKKVIWIHAVSVGESVAAAGFVSELQKRYAEYALVVTCTTVTGSQRIKKLYGDDVFHVFFPYDLPIAINSFLNKLNPCIAIFMETELWPNLTAACYKRKIPMAVANARLSERSASGYLRFSILTGPMMNQLSCILAQHDEDAERFVKIGASKDAVKVTGTVKYDAEPPESVRHTGNQLRKKWLQSKSSDTLIVIAASTHKGEDSKIINAFIEARKAVPHLLLLLVPRHPEQFLPVKQLAEQAALNVISYSSGDEVKETTDCIIGDVMGEMMNFFATSDIAIMGGSFVDVGGHNMLEPASLGVPCITGNILYNFKDISAKLSETGALLILKDNDTLASALTELCRDQVKRAHMAEAGLKVIASNKGALNKQLQCIFSFLDSKEPNEQLMEEQAIQETDSV